ncbi:hypothetical protein FE78DRAFT_72516 [Lecanosticta acicola]|uniref:Uncharacterized protein n=1 Tax=Lecanosticta acicola TaxID=111012 RepID=A0AAI8YZT5_9PEZI|nr:hypothetical protein FE78DRAFT_72516 [Lecanosticta acicola]
MLSWSTIQSLLIFFGPWFIPRAIAYYRAIRNRPASQIKSLPQKTSYGLTILFISGIIALVGTLPAFQPENIFRTTQSRLQTATGVLLTRLAAVRPLTSKDETLRRLFETGGLQARLLYARYGPTILLANPLTTLGTLDASKFHLLYALPSLLAPHILHFFALGITTSTTLSGSEPARWRTVATIAALILPAAEIYYLSTTPQDPRQTELNFLAWKVPIYRGLAIACLDSLLGLAIYLQSTNRAFLNPPSPSQQLLAHTSRLETLLASTRKLGVIRNATVRDKDMRRRVQDYWFQESEVMKDVHEEPEVLEAQRNALRRLDMVKIGREVEQFVTNILGSEGPRHGGAPPVPVHAPGTVASVI